MSDAVSRLSTALGFPAQTGDRMWDGASYWTMLAADSLLALVNLSLAAALIYLAASRRELHYRAVAVFAAAFFLVCAVVQAADAWIGYAPAPSAAVSVAIAGLAVLAAIIAAVLAYRLGLAIFRNARALGRHDAARDLEREIAHRMRLEEQLAEARNEAMAANRTKSRFLAYMSHELRTPLNAILGFSQVIGDELLGRSDRRRYIQYVRDIQSSGEHLLDIVNEVLEISRIESGKAVLADTVIETRELIADVERMVSVRARDAGIGLAVSVDRGVPQLIADMRMVKQILLNLLSNAIKFTPAGGSVTIAATLALDGGIRLGVSDTGAGMPANDIPRALEPFGNAQSDQPRGNGVGFGLGLPICKGLAELHGAALEINSAVGRGTVVLVHFPAVRTKLQALAG